MFTETVIKNNQKSEKSFRPLITQRSQVQILSPLPIRNARGNSLAFCIYRGATGFERSRPCPSTEARPYGSADFLQGLRWDYRSLDKFLHRGNFAIGAEEPNRATTRPTRPCEPARNQMEITACPRYHL